MRNCAEAAEPLWAFVSAYVEIIEVYILEN